MNLIQNSKFRITNFFHGFNFLLHPVRRRPGRDPAVHHPEESGARGHLPGQRLFRPGAPLLPARGAPGGGLGGDHLRRRDHGPVPLHHHDAGTRSDQQVAGRAGALGAGAALSVGAARLHPAAGRRRPGSAAGMPRYYASPRAFGYALFKSTPWPWRSSPSNSSSPRWAPITSAPSRGASAGRSNHDRADRPHPDLCRGHVLSRPRLRPRSAAT